MTHPQNLPISESHRVPDLVEPKRLSEYARGVFVSLPSRKSVKKAIKSGRLLVDGRPSYTGHFVRSGEVLTVLRSPEPAAVYDLELRVIFEDDHLAVVVKPGDLPVGGFMRRNLDNALPGNLTVTSLPDALPRPVPVHRLDRLTSGLVVVAKTFSAAAELGGFFENRRVEKGYLAVVHGILGAPMRIEHPLDGKEAITEVAPIAEGAHAWGQWTVVNVQPITGRTHQIRRHLSMESFPIVGDVPYGGKSVRRGLMLCARKIRFPHPVHGEIPAFEMDLPRKFKSFLRRVARDSSLGN